MVCYIFILWYATCYIYSIARYILSTICYTTYYLVYRTPHSIYSMVRYILFTLWCATYYLLCGTLHIIYLMVCYIFIYGAKNICLPSCTIYIYIYIYKTFTFSHIPSPVHGRSEPPPGYPRCAWPPLRCRRVLTSPPRDPYITTQGSNQKHPPPRNTIFGRQVESTHGFPK